MDPTNDVNEDAVSDPLVHLLSLELKSSIKKLKDEECREQPIKIKRVRFSDEVNQISYDVLDEKDSSILLNHVENVDDDNNIVMTINSSSLSDQDETDIFPEETESKTCMSSLHVENTVDSDKNNEVNFNSLNTSSEDSSDIIPTMEDLVIRHSSNTNILLQDSCESELKGVSSEMKNGAYEVNDVINQIEGLSLEITELEMNDSISSVKTSQQHSDVFSISIDNSVAECERLTDNTGFPVVSLKKRSDYQKQSCKLNSALTKKSTFSSASELSSAVFKAWCEVKDNTKDIKHIPLNEIKASDTRTTSDNAYSVWKKSKVEAFKKAKKDKQNSIFKNTYEETSENKTEEIELAFKAWKKKKDEILKQQKMNMQVEKQKLNMVSLMDDREKKMEADVAFSAWKEHKSHIIKLDKKHRDWIMLKQKEEENKKNLRDKEALNMYYMWLENKNSPAKRNATNPVKNKPPWSPPGNSYIITSHHW